MGRPQTPLRNGVTMKFKSEDFFKEYVENMLAPTLAQMRKIVANEADAKLQAWLEEAPEVLGWLEKDGLAYDFSESRLYEKNQTHKARLVRIESLERSTDEV